MKSLFLVLILLLAGAPVHAAESPLKINWDTLIPDLTPLENPFTHLTMDQRVELDLLYGIREEHRLGYLSAVDPRYEEGVEYEHNLKEAGLDPDALITQYKALEAEINRRNEAVDMSLDGKLVKMPGFALPLEFSETAVREFLLVPYIGACVHVAAPPANQTVYVDLENDPYFSRDLFEPVWIVGRMQVKRVTKNLDYVDGQADVNAAYTLIGHRVEPYLE